jgi:plasmid maintenance system antidote protein VapI
MLMTKRKPATVGEILVEEFMRQGTESRLTASWPEDL